MDGLVGVGIDKHIKLLLCSLTRERMRGERMKLMDLHRGRDEMIEYFFLAAFVCARA